MNDMIYNVGIDEDLFETGLSYNAYLILGTKNILIDGVPLKHSECYIKNIEAIVSIDKIDSIIFNHASPDRCASLISILEKNPDITVYASTAGLRNISQIVNLNFKQHVCKNGEELDTKSVKLKFYITPNVAWPDTMITYDSESKILFSGDMFSSITTSNSEKAIESFFMEKLIFSKSSVKTAVECIEKLDVAAIYPGHGREITDDIDEVINNYIRLCSSGKINPKKITIVYCSAFGCTRTISEIIEKTLSDLGFTVNSFDATVFDMKRLADEVYTSAALIVGTLTKNRNMPNSIWRLISKLNINFVSKKPYFVFGSTGWSGEGVFLASEIMSMLRMRKFAPPVTVTLYPSSEEINNVKDYTKKFAAWLSEVYNA